MWSSRRPRTVGERQLHDEEDAMDVHTSIGAFREGETLELVQPSARRREYELRRAGQGLG
jgi:hypothetical protein